MKDNGYGNVCERCLFSSTTNRFGSTHWFCKYGTYEIDPFNKQYCSEFKSKGF